MLPPLQIFQVEDPIEEIHTQLGTFSLGVAVKKNTRKRDVREIQNNYANWCRVRGTTPEESIAEV